MSKLSDQIDERANAWLDPIKDMPEPSRSLSPNFSIGTALQEVARAIRSVEDAHPKRSEVKLQTQEIESDDILSDW